MSFDRASLAAAVARSGRAARVVVAATQGSVPRETGAAMVVTDTETNGTIGGGALEFDAIARARACLASGEDSTVRIPLGPGLGQCCGGAVTLVTEVWTAERLNALGPAVVARPLPGEAARPAPMAVRRILAAARNGGAMPEVQLVAGWFVEPVTPPVRPVWIYGAGHVGRAIAAVLALLPGLAVTLVDDAPARFPDPLGQRITPLVARNPADAVRLAPGDATHLVLTYSHALDLEICHRVLSRDFAGLGLIGSATKRARFRSRLAQLGHTAAQIDRMRCPIGDPGLGKHPQAIAVGVAADFLKPDAAAERGEKRA
jgi:xanthine dehydrogenase accessory factor